MKFISKEEWVTRELAKIPAWTEETDRELRQILGLADPATTGERP
ncbi:hypothetical protein [Streptomyces sp. NPDC014733]